MSIAALNSDILSILVEFMDALTFASFRVVFKVPWTCSKVKQYGKCAIKRLEHTQSERLSANLCFGIVMHPFDRIDRMLCVECRHTPITFIEWKGKLMRRCIPWCTIHVPGPLMDDVLSYCVGP